MGVVNIFWTGTVKGFFSTRVPYISYLYSAQHYSNTRLLLLLKQVYTPNNYSILSPKPISTHLQRTSSPLVIETYSESWSGGKKAATLLTTVHCPKGNRFSQKYNTKCSGKSRYYAEYFVKYLVFLYISCYISEILITFWTV